MTYAMTAWRGGAIQEATIRPDMFESFLKYVDAKPQTVETYRRALKPFFLYLAEGEISNPSRPEILAYRDRLKQSKAAATVRLYIAAVRRFFSWTEQEGLYPDIARGIKGAEVTDGFKRDYLGKVQMEGVLQSIGRDGLAGKRDYAILRLMATTGLRTIEITRANIEDLTLKGGCMVLYVQGKGRDDRAEYVKIGKSTEEAVREYLEARGDVEGKSPLFASESDRNRGGRMTAKSISRIAKNGLKAAGFNSKRLTAHSFRHSAATIALDSGVPIEQIRQTLRHRDPRTTEIYLHTIDRAKNNMEIMLDGLFA